MNPADHDDGPSRPHDHVPPHERHGHVPPHERHKHVPPHERHKHVPPNERHGHAPPHERHKHGHKHPPHKRHGPKHQHHPAHPGEGPFGVRRPLRVLKHELGLDEGQVRRVAELIDDLKTEEAQRVVDERRNHKALVASFSAETFDGESASEAMDALAASDSARRRVLVDSLAALHEVLEPDQRAHFAMLVRTGVVRL